MRNRRSKPTLERLIPKIDFTDSCWLWNASVNGHGYGQIYDHSARKPRLAYRLLYEEFHGPVGTGLELDHLCRNRLCVNPDHLEPVTHRVNVMRGAGIMAVHAARTVCVNGHDYTSSTTYIRPNGTRTCRVCKRIRDRKPSP